MDDRRRSWAPLAVACASGCLLAWGAFALLQFTDDEDIPLFWVRLAVGTALAIATVWAAWTDRLLFTAFFALGCCITPVGDGWTWVQLLYIGLALWALARFFTEIIQGKRV